MTNDTHGLIHRYQITLACVYKRVFITFYLLEHDSEARILSGFFLCVLFLCWLLRCAGNFTVLLPFRRTFVFITYTSVIARDFARPIYVIARLRGSKAEMFALSMSDESAINRRTDTPNFGIDLRVR